MAKVSEAIDALSAAAMKIKRQRDELLRALKHAIQYVDYPDDKINYERVIEECEDRGMRGRPMTNNPNGVVAVIIGPDGYVWASESDFEQVNGIGNIESQTHHARRCAINSFFRAACNQVVADAIDAYQKEQIMRNLQSKGWRIHVVKIGYGDGEAK